MSDAVTVAIALIDRVLSFLQEELSRYGKVVTDVNRIKGHLRDMEAYLQDAEGREGRSQMMRVLVTNIRDVAHEMEDVLDDYMIHAPRVFSPTPFLQKGYQVCHNLKHRSPVLEIQSKIASIDASMSRIMGLPQIHELVRIVHLPTQNQNQNQLHPSSSSSQMVEVEDEMVGMDSHRDDLISLLTPERSGGCKAISVVGPSGAGKTVLVSSVYKTKGRFDCHAWLSFSIHSHMTDTHEQRLQNLLSQFCMLDSPVGGDTATKLNSYLWDKKFLLVLDGVRKDEEWSSIKQALSVSASCSNGSRIIITTQNETVARSCAGSDKHILYVKGLDWKASWRLFCNKAYRGEKCPTDLFELSQFIVKKCEGLPQPISAVGTLLSSKPRLPREWSRVHANLAAEMQGNSAGTSCVNTMFLLSYYDLPSNQKSCLLYFGLFPEDYSIKRERLIRLWLSEGFVAGHEAAENILNELISRNLVDASSRDFRGRVKSCRVLNLMREFISQKSKEKNFGAVVTDLIHQRYGTIHRRLSIEDAASGLTKMRDLRLESVRSVFMFALERASFKMLAETLQRIC